MQFCVGILAFLVERVNLAGDLVGCHLFSEIPVTPYLAQPVLVNSRLLCLGGCGVLVKGLGVGIVLILFLAQKVGNVLILGIFLSSGVPFNAGELAIQLNEIILVLGLSIRITIREVCETILAVCLDRFIVVFVMGVKTVLEGILQFGGRLSRFLDIRPERLVNLRREIPRKPFQFRIHSLLGFVV
ncbi:MAG: hypothetical protein RBG13Loki_0430 [Promethearchaeota archaeon CR_4]|nr:MAG: hypothetical protein RBG13Loki_0430 [Candidatus Lokiarchaeota archaeon CR_4]